LNDGNQISKLTSEIKAGTGAATTTVAAAAQGGQPYELDTYNLLNQLVGVVTDSYTASYPNVDSQAAIAFFMRYPSPSTLEGTTHEDLAAFLREASDWRVGAGKPGTVKAQEILDTLQDTTVPFQEIRDDAVRSTIRQIVYNSGEIDQLEKTLAEFLEQFQCTLTSMNGINTVSAAQILSCIGDIKRFSTPAKLARYSGIAPVTHASGKKDLQFANHRGNRELNYLLYMLSMRMINMPVDNKMLNPFFYEYYHRKLSEGKTKKQALKCVQRRLVNIIWTMLTNHEEYVNPPMFEAPNNGKDDT